MFMHEGHFGCIYYPILTTNNTNEKIQTFSQIKQYNSTEIYIQKLLGNNYFKTHPIFKKFIESD